MKKQVVVIHGGTTFATYKQYLAYLKKEELNFEKATSKRWKDHLGEKLGKGFEVVMPLMPNSANARYLEWKIWFEKLFPFLEKEVVLLGHSLGGLFLAKYLSERKFPKKILGTLLVAPPYDGEGSEESLDYFKLKKDLSGLQKQSGKLIFYHSQDDENVPMVDFVKYKKALPDACFRDFKNRGHFVQKNFPEIVREIKKLYNQ